LTLTLTKKVKKESKTEKIMGKRERGGVRRKISGYLWKLHSNSIGDEDSVKERKRVIMGRNCIW